MKKNGQSPQFSTLDKEVHAQRKQQPGNAGQGQPLVFKDPEPWPNPICGDSLIDGLISTIRRYVSLSEESALAAALWVIHTHAFAQAQFSPRLTLSSPEKRCGKTTLLFILGGMAAKSLPAANVTTAALFRIIEKVQPTLLIDEADTFIRNSDELRGVLNSGHSRTNAFVLRTVGDDHEPRRFSTWAPVAIALIGKLPDTLEDRSIVIPMRRRLPGEAGERLRMDRAADLILHKRQCARWACSTQTWAAGLIQVRRSSPPRHRYASQRMLSGARDEVLLTATAQNLRKLVKYASRSPPIPNLA